MGRATEGGHAEVISTGYFPAVERRSIRAPYPMNQWACRAAFASKGNRSTMADNPSAAPEPDPQHNSPANSARKSGNGGRSRKNDSRPAATVIWRNKWFPLSGRVTARRPGVLCWRRTFAGTPEQVSAARQFIRYLLADSSAADDGAWVAGELATNASAP
jgi:hypothetical protein